MTTTERPWSATVRLDEIGETGRHVELEASDAVRVRARQTGRCRFGRAAGRDASISPGVAVTAVHVRGAVSAHGPAELRGHARSGRERHRRGDRRGLCTRPARRWTQPATKSRSTPRRPRSRSADRKYCRPRACSRPSSLILGIDPYPRKAGRGLRCAQGRCGSRESRSQALAACRKRAQSRNNCAGRALCVRQPNRYCRPRGANISHIRTLSKPMAQKVRIALDAMGGDFGPRSWFPAPIFRSPAIPTPNSSCSATRP